ncbi:MAG: hypothetical protein OEV06_07100, partial [Anaerolineae bacterium]|nr:hypothetical protein [Anaerolineae bacterium]
MNNISILTYHHIANNGAALFAYSMQQALRELFPANTVRILDYRDVGMQAYEWLKTLKPFRQIPAFNLQRRRTFSQFQDKEFQYDAGLGRTTRAQKLARRLASPDQAAWITGMDVWNIGSVRWLPGFPNPYWLPWEGRAKKIAYAVSGYRSDDDAVEQEMDRLGEL